MNIARRRYCFIPITLSLAVFGTIVLSVFTQGSGSSAIATSEKAAVTSAKSLSVRALSSAEVQAHREHWQPLVQRVQNGQSLLPADVDLLEERKKELKALMTKQPEAAAQLAISMADWESLPEQARIYFEQPFSAEAKLNVYPDGNCRQVPALREKSYPTRELVMNGQVYATTVYGTRVAHLSKQAAPIGGFTLDGLALVVPATFDILKPGDESKLAHLPLGAPKAKVDIFTGERLAASPVVAVAGGKRFLFNDAKSVAELNARIAALDERAGPENGGALIMKFAAGLTDNAIDWSTLNDTSNRIAYSWTAAERKFLLIRVEFSDLNSTIGSYSEWNSMLNGRVANGFYEMSYGKLNMVSTVSTQVFRLGTTASFTGAAGPYGKLTTDGIAAYEAVHGAGSTAAFQHIGIVYPPVAGLSPLLGIVGGRDTWYSEDQVGYYGIVHELGHNLGLGHAESWQTTDGSITGAGSTVDYGNSWDTMGSGGLQGHFHAQGKARLNWLDATNWADATAAGSGIRRIYRFDHPATAVTNALRAVRATRATNEYYWIDYRKGIPDNIWFDSGLQLQWQKAGRTNCQLLDTTPNSANGRADAALTMGRTFADTAAGVYITPVAQGGSGADSWIDANVQIGTFTGNQPPAVTLSPDATTVQAGVPLSFSTTASDPNADTLAYAWSWGDTRPSVNSASPSHAWDIAGTYTVSVTVSDMKGGTASANTIITVTDTAASWTAGQIVSGVTHYDVIYKHGRFVVSSWDKLWFSYDGTTWTSTDVSGGSYGIAAADDSLNFVAVGTHAIYHSTDGKHWTPRVTGYTGSLNEITYGEGTFVAVGGDGLVMRSTDGGRTWTNHTISGAATLHDVTYGNGKFMAVAYFELYVSDDGITWTNKQASTGSPSWGSWRTVAFHDGSFYASGNQTEVRVSSDGVNWARKRFNGDISHTVQRIVPGPGRLLASSAVDGGGGNSLLSSLDGELWFDSGVTTLPEALDFIYADGRYFGVYSDDTYHSLTDYPTNSVPAVSITAPASSTAQTVVTFQSNVSDADGDAVTLIWDFLDGTDYITGSSVQKTYAFGGNYQVRVTATDRKGGVSTATHNIVIDDPLVHWTNGEIVAGRFMSMATYLNGRYIVTADRWAQFSIDGSTWSSQDMGGNFRGRAVASDGTRYIMVGSEWNGSAWYGTAWTSLDGKTWTLNRPNLGSELYAITYGHGKFIAGGSSGSVRITTDGTTWTNVTIPGAGRLLRIVSTSIGFVAIESSKVWVSTDGVTWENRRSYTQNPDEFKDMVAVGDNVYIVGWNNGIQASTDGGMNYVRRDVSGGGTYDLFRVSAGNGMILASGNLSGSPVLVASRDGVTWINLNVGTVPAATSLTYAAGRFFGVQGSNGDTYYSDSFFPANQASTGSITAPATAAARTPITFTAIATDADGDPLTYLWDMNDGSPLAGGSSITKTYAGGGTFNVTCAVTDKHGGVVTLTHNLVVTDPLLEWTLRHSISNGVSSGRHLRELIQGKDSLGNDQVLAVGRFVILKSVDGSTWTNARSPAEDTARIFWGGLYTGSRYVICGEHSISGTWNGSVHTSTDGGATWSDRYRAGLNIIYYDIAMDDHANPDLKVLIAAGTSGSIIRSADGGQTWALVNHGLTTARLRGVAWHAGRFVAAGDGVVLTSTDGGLTWTNVTTTLGLAGNWWEYNESIEYLNDSWFFAGENLDIRYAPDDLTSATNIDITPDPIILGLAHGNGIYLAVGTDKASGTDVNFVSIDGANWQRLTTTDQQKRNSALYYKGTFLTVSEFGTIWQSGIVTLPQLLVRNGATDLPSGTGSLDLGTVLPGTSANATAILANTGTADLTITAISAGGDFSVTAPALPVIVQPGQSISMPITYQSTTSGPDTAMLTIMSDGSGGTPYTISLTGLSNTPPTFTGLTLNLHQGSSSIILDSTLLARASDADGHTLSVTGIGAATTAHGGTVTRGSSQTTYTAPAGYTGTDSCQVMITDGFTTVPATITINLSADGGLTDSTPLVWNLTSGNSRISVAALPGFTYGVMRSTNLTSWTQIGTVTADANGLASFEDTNPPIVRGFYRFIFPVE